MLRTDAPTIETNATRRAEWREMPDTHYGVRDAATWFGFGVLIGLFGGLLVGGVSVLSLLGSFGREVWKWAGRRPDPEGRAAVTIEYRAGKDPLGGDAGYLALGPDWLWFEGGRTEFCIALTPDEFRRAKAEPRTSDYFRLLSHGVEIRVKELREQDFHALLAESRTHPAAPAVAEILPVNTVSSHPPMRTRRVIGLVLAASALTVVPPVLLFLPLFEFRQRHPALATKIGLSLVVLVVLVVLVFAALAWRRRRDALFS